MSCPDCFKGSVHDHATPRGRFENLHGYRTYVAGASSTTSSSSTSSTSTIIYLPDAFSLKLVNNKLLADRYASETGCQVLLPDIIPNGGMDARFLAYGEQVQQPAGLNPFAWLRRIYLVAKMIYHVVPFFVFSRAPKIYPSVLRYARAVKADLPSGAKLGVCGFCWGGYGATRLCTETAAAVTAADENSSNSSSANSSSTRLIDASFVAHPGFLKTPDMIIDAIKTHRSAYSLAVAEKDFLYDGKKARETEAACRTQIGEASQNNYEIKIYKDCPHGFAVRSNPNSKVEAQGYEDAATQAVQWFRKYLL